MAVRNKGVVANDPEVRERANIIGHRVSPAETAVQLVDLLNREHDPSYPLMSDQKRAVRP
jgi:hypothetical protein